MSLVEKLNELYWDIDAAYVRRGCSSSSEGFAGVRSIPFSLMACALLPCTIEEQAGFFPLAQLACSVAVVDFLSCCYSAFVTPEMMGGVLLVGRVQ